MASVWFVFIALLGALAQGRRLPRHSFNDAPEAHVAQPTGVELARVPLAHAPQTSVAICRLVSSPGHQVSGDVVLRQINAEDPVEITGSISGLAPGYHGFHIHQNANLSDNCKGAGSHFNPKNLSHGGPQDSIRHSGDLGNIPADENGISTFQILDNRISLFEEANRQILGRSIVLHEKEDDLGKGGDEESKKTGNAGARVACCIVEPAPYN